MKKKLLILLVLSGYFGSTNAQIFYRTTRLPVNSNVNNEMAPTIYEDGIVFSSDKKSDVILTTVDQTGHYTYNLYFSRRKGPKAWTSETLFSKELATRYNESSVCFSADGNTLYYTGTVDAQGKVGDDSGDTLKNGLFISTWNGKEWTLPEAFPYNSTEYDLGHPSVTSDGNRLYFAGRGLVPGNNYDIYYSNRVNGQWQKPVNMGPVINTPGNEVFPFIYKDNRLYFASDGHEGRGGLDIFYSDNIDGEWIKPVDMPTPFNSRSDDFGLVANAEMDTGYFATNRRGTDDIYMFLSAFPTFDECPEQVDETFCYEFYESGTMSLDTTTLRYEWDLGDGTRIRNVRASHCYAEPGYYLVQLNVIDTLTGEVYYSEASYDLNVEPLEQPYMLSPDTVAVNENITFDASQSAIRSFTIENYYWDFGDGGVENEVKARHRYAKAGTYIVRLGITGTGEAVDEEGQKACASKKILVRRVR